MAKPTHKQVELAELVRRSEAARFSIAEAHQDLMHKLDMPSRIKESMRAQPAKWIGGSIIAGYLGSFFFRSRRPKVREEARISKKPRKPLPMLLSTIAILSKPAVKMYATKLLKDYIENQLVKRAGIRPGAIKRPPY